MTNGCPVGAVALAGPRYTAADGDGAGAAAVRSIRRSAISGAGADASTALTASTAVSGGSASGARFDPSQAQHSMIDAAPCAM